MIILHNKTHAENIRVCMGIFMTTLRNKKYSQILNENTLPYFLIALLVCDCLLCCNRAVWANYPFLGLLLLREGPSLSSRKPRINNLLKRLLFNIATVRQQAKHCGSKVRYFYWEFDYIFIIPKSGRKYSHANSYIFSLILATQYDHLTAWAWAICSCQGVRGGKGWIGIRNV